MMEAMDKFCYRVVPEKTLYIDLPHTNLKLKAILRGDLDQPTVIMVHGLPGSGNDLLQYLGAKYLYEQGLTTLRLFLYDWEANTRNLADCTVETHAEDFDTVVKYLRTQNVPKIFAQGHSYGGLTILRAKEKIDGAVLWDPSHGLVFRDPEVLKFYENDAIQETEKLKLYLNGAGYIEPKAITKEQDELGDNSDWAAHKGYPLEIISAGQGFMVDLHKQYLEVADDPKEQKIIKTAHHVFDDSDEVVLELFKATADWFKRILWP